MNTSFQVALRTLCCGLLAMASITATVVAYGVRPEVLLTFNSPSAPDASEIIYTANAPTQDEPQPPEYFAQASSVTRRDFEPAATVANPFAEDGDFRGPRGSLATDREVVGSGKVSQFATPDMPKLPRQNSPSWAQGRAHRTRPSAADVAEFTAKPQLSSAVARAHARNLPPHPDHLNVQSDIPAWDREQNPALTQPAAIAENPFANEPQHATDLSPIEPLHPRSSEPVTVEPQSVFNQSQESAPLTNTDTAATSQEPPAASPGSEFNAADSVPLEAVAPNTTETSKPEEAESRASEEDQGTPAETIIAPPPPAGPSDTPATPQKELPPVEAQGRSEDIQTPHQNAKKPGSENLGKSVGAPDDNQSPASPPNVPPQFRIEPLPETHPINELRAPAPPAVDTRAPANTSKTGPALIERPSLTPGLPYPEPRSGMSEASFVDRLTQMQRQLDHIAQTQQQDRQSVQSYQESAQLMQQRRLEEKLATIEQGLKELKAQRDAAHPPQVVHPAPQNVTSPRSRQSETREATREAVVQVPPSTTPRRERRTASPVQSPVEAGADDSEQSEPLPKPPAPVVREVRPGSDGQRRFTVNSQHGDVREVLDALAQKANFNLVLSVNVEGDVELSLQNVTADEALDAIKRSTGYVVEKSGRKVFVSSPRTHRYQRDEFLPPIIKDAP